MKALNKAEREKTGNQKSQNRLMEIFKNKLINRGMKLLNRDSTYKRNNYESMIDVMITNRCNKISSIDQIGDSPSDHDILILNRKMEIKPVEESYIRIRDFNKIKDVDMNKEILENDEYEKVINHKGSNNIAKSLAKLINNVFNKYSPIKKIKIMNDDKVINNKHIKEAIKVRNEAYILMKNENTPENKNDYKNKKNHM